VARRNGKVFVTGNTGFPKNLDLGDGLGTALKPACEFWILVRRPPDGTLKKTVIDWGTGGLNIDACRVGDDVRVGVGVAVPSSPPVQAARRRAAERARRAAVGQRRSAGRKNGAP